jgi:hypothetical protein
MCPTGRRLGPSYKEYVQSDPQVRVRVRTRTVHTAHAAHGVTDHHMSAKSCGGQAKCSRCMSSQVRRVQVAPAGGSRDASRMGGPWVNSAALA